MPNHNNLGNIIGYRLHELFIRPFPKDADSHKVRIEVFNHTRVRIHDVRVRKASAFVVYSSDEGAARALEIFQRSPLYINGTRLEVNYTAEYADDIQNKHGSSRRDQLRSPVKRISGLSDNSSEFLPVTNAYLQNSCGKNSCGDGKRKGNHFHRSLDRHHDGPCDCKCNRSYKLEVPFYREIKAALAEFSGVPDMNRLSSQLEQISLNPSISNTSRYLSYKCTSIYPVCGFFPENTSTTVSPGDPPGEVLSVKQLQRMYMELVGKNREKKPKERFSKKRQGAARPDTEPQPLPLGMGRGFCRGISEIKGLQESFSAIPTPLPPKVAQKLGRGILGLTETEIQSRIS